MITAKNKINKHIKEINHLLVINNFKVEMETEKDYEGNTTFTYTGEYKNRKFLGIVGLNNSNEFYGLIADMSKFAYLAKEGFADMEHPSLENEKVWRGADSPIAFVASLAYPNYKDLKLE